MVTAWSAWSAGETVCIVVTFPSSVLNSKLKGLELFDPPGYLSFWLFEGHEPLQGSVVSADSERQATEDMLEMAHSIDHCQEFPASDAVVLLWLIEGATVVSNNTLALWGQLREYGAKTCVAGVRVEDKRQLRVGCNQHRVLA